MSTNHAGHRTGPALRRLRSCVVAAVLAVAAGALAAPAQARPVHASRAHAAAAPRSACGAAAAGAARCFAEWLPAAQPGAAGSAGILSAANQPKGLRPSDLAAAYRLDSSRGSGQTVAIVDAFDDPSAEADLAHYRATWGLPACTTANGCLRKTDEHGGRHLPQPDSGWSLEISLDLQAASAVCPRCSLLLVEGDSPSLDDLGTAVNTAVRLGASVVSNSYGTTEFGGLDSYLRKYYAHPGTAIVASSGDEGFGPAQFPAVGGSVIGVGGTTLTHDRAGWHESAWGGAGSGCSAWVSKPAWQHDGHCSMRTTSDISAVADPDTGLAVYDTYGLGDQSGWLIVGGTSLSAPLIAATIGLAGDGHTYRSAQRFYLPASRSGLSDPVGGSNGYCGGDYLCTGLPGYDAPTGNGSPRGLGAF